MPFTDCCMSDLAEKTSMLIPDGFEVVDSPGCGSNRYTLDHEWRPDGHGGAPLRVVRCEACGLHFLNPRPDPAHIGAYYPNDYTPYQRDSDDEERGSGIRQLILRTAYAAPHLKPAWPGRIVARIASLFRSPQS